MNFASLIGPRVLKERKRLDLSQEEAATACGVSREMWGKYERGKAEMGTEVLSKFAVAGANVLFILTGEEVSCAPALAADESALLDNYRHSPEDQQRLLRETSAAFSQRHKRKRSA